MGAFYLLSFASIFVLSLTDESIDLLQINSLTDVATMDNEVRTGVSDHVTAGWDPASITKQLGDVFGDATSSFEKTQKKFAKFADKFSKRLNHAVARIEGQLTDLKAKVKAQTRDAKVKTVTKITERVVKLGTAAVVVATKITAKIEVAQKSVMDALQAVSRAKAPEKFAELQKSLDARVQVLNDVVTKLKQAMHLKSVTSLLSKHNNSVSSGPDVPGVVAATEAKVKHVLLSSNEALDGAKVYIAFVNKTINEAQQKVLSLTKMLNNATDNANDNIDKAVDSLIALLQNSNKMFQGKIDMNEAKAYIKSGSQTVATSGAVTAVILMMASFMGRSEA